MNPDRKRIKSQPSTQESKPMNARRFVSAVEAAARMEARPNPTTLVLHQSSACDCVGCDSEGLMVDFWKDPASHELVKMYEPAATAKLYQVLATTNDRNGNPRRLTVVYHSTTGDMLEVLEHGYAGRQIPPGASELVSVRITTEEYRIRVASAKQLNIYKAV